MREFVGFLFLLLIFGCGENGSSYLDSLSFQSEPSLHFAIFFPHDGEVVIDEDGVIDVIGYAKRDSIYSLRINGRGVKNWNGDEFRERVRLESGDNYIVFSGIESSDPPEIFMRVIKGQIPFP